MLFNIKKYLAFTLSEVLIVIAIIGVVAAIGIPTLYNATNQAEIVMAEKKVYADFMQAATRLKIDNSGDFTGLCPTAYDNFCMMNRFLEYMKYIKTCPANTGSGNCWSAEWYYTDGGLITDSPTSHATAVLNNGAMVMFRYHETTCTVNTCSGTACCGWLYVDVNGFKSPNKVGEDILHFYLYKDKLSIVNTDDTLMYQP
ncbi:MAG: type II secretion system protein [Candidatus Gastranaerophilales bacterium]|nr:type II secretion system protein [Candidatus Gastranaerophilales bacterium]